MAVVTRWPLVGRRDELDTFTRALDDPGCQGVCIYGPSGVGKTRLGEECADLAAAAGRRTLRAAADPSTSEIPFGPVGQCLIGHPTEGKERPTPGPETKVPRSARPGIPGRRPTG
jgi:hypothetical protein